MDVLDGLNPAQREAVEAIEGPLLIVAGPGSGKTRVITARIAHLVRTCGVRPFRIMAVTFTNKAAREMRERLERLLGKAATDVSMGTFHALCARILRVEAQHAGLDKAFAIYDADDQTSLVRRAMKDAEVDPKRFGPSAMRNGISAAKAKLLDPEGFAQRRASYFDEVVFRVYERYQHLLAQSNALDFDDLLMKSVCLLEGNDEVLKKYQERYVHVMIDEFQDTSMVQYRFARLMAGRHLNLCVVGDPDQSIYSWRFAEIGNILDFERDYPGAKAVMLEQNYRSTESILNAASQVIARNRGRKAKDLWTDKPGGALVTIADAMNEHDEAHVVAQETERLRKGGRRYGDMAVLYRTNAQSRPIEEAFIRYGIPYRLVGATRFYERREVKDMLAYMRLVHNPYDDVSLLRVINVPARGIGQRTLDELTRWATAEGLPLYPSLQLLAAGVDGAGAPEFTQRTLRSLGGFIETLQTIADDAKEGRVTDLLDLLLERTGYRDHLLSSNDRGEERLENVMELRGAALDFADQPFEEGLTGFLENVALVSDTDDLDQRANSVTLITLHQAKGLEFPYVFMIGLEEGVLPHHRAVPDAEQLEEERRLCYVGMTRAEDGLYLLRAYRRTMMGQRGQNPPSRFLADIPGELTVAGLREGVKQRSVGWGHEGVSRAQTAVKAGPPPFNPGDRVQHDAFGAGVVVNCDRTGDDHQVTVAFRGEAGIKRLLHSLAGLVKS